MTSPKASHRDLASTSCPIPWPLCYVLSSSPHALMSSEGRSPVFPPEPFLSRLSRETNRNGEPERGHVLTRQRLWETDGTVSKGNITFRVRGEGKVFKDASKVRLSKAGEGRGSGEQKGSRGLWQRTSCFCRKSCLLDSVPPTRWAGITSAL